MAKYQGKEFTASMQAPSRESLETLIEGMQDFAASHSLGEVEVLQLRSDPDGGWEAVVKAHNWNPISWVKEKLQRKPKVSPKELPPPDAGDWYRRYTEEREGRAQAEADLRTEQAARQKRAREEAEIKQAKKEGRYREPPETEEGFLSRVPPELREEYKKRVRGGARERAEAAFEIWEAGTPEEKTLLHRVFQPGYWAGREGRPIPAPETAEEKRGAEYHPGEYVFQRVQVPVSPTERLAEARALKVHGAQTREALAEAEAKRRARKTAPYRAVGRAAGTLAKEVVGATSMGIAGVAQSIQPGRGGPARASRMLTPQVHPSLLRVSPPVPQMSTRGLQGRPAQPQPPGLSYLRRALLPGGASLGSQLPRKMRLF